MNVSLGLQRIVHRCLEKKPAARFQSASDLAFALDSLTNAGNASTGGLRALKEEKSPRSRFLIPALLLAAVAVGALATYFLSRSPATHQDFTQISFHNEYIRHARFAPDGRTVVYDSTTGGKPTQLFSTRTDTIEAQSLNIPASLLSISSTGELAVTLDTRFDPKYTPTGRLARVPIGGGSTRELLDAVTDADWTPDGSALAVSRQVGHHFQLEYPIGKTLYQNDGYISDVCFSPAGDKIAFVDHALFGDDRGNVDVVDLKGNRKVLTREFSTVQGLAWATKGNEIWFSAAVNAEPSSLRAVSLEGKERVLLSTPSKLKLQDVSKDGSVLLTVEDYRDAQILSETADGKVRDVSSFPFQITEAFSSDGKSLLLNTYVTGGNSDYNLYTQKTDGSAPALIGQGAGLSFSFDGKWATAVDPLNLQHMRIIPTGVGEARTLNAPVGTQYMGAAWMPDNKHLLVLALVPGHAPDNYLQDIETGAAQKIKSEGKYLSTGQAGAGSVSPDGKYFLAIDNDLRYWVQPVDGGPASEIKGLSPGDIPTEWHGGSQNIFFERPIGTDISEIYDLNLATGASKLWSHFTPADKIAMLALRHAIITQDGAHALYVVQRIFSTLFVANGIK
jgi:Tol biopolymer transport system component